MTSVPHQPPTPNCPLPRPMEYPKMGNACEENLRKPQPDLQMDDAPNGLATRCIAQVALKRRSNRIDCPMEQRRR